MSCKSDAATGEVKRSEEIKLLSSRKATVQPEATLFFFFYSPPPTRQERRGLAHPVFHTLGSAACMREACK